MLNKKPPTRLRQRLYFGSVVRVKDRFCWQGRTIAAEPIFLVGFVGLPNINSLKYQHCTVISEVQRSILHLLGRQYEQRTFSQTFLKRCFGRCVVLLRYHDNRWVSTLVTMRTVWWGHLLPWEQLVRTHVVMTTVEWGYLLPWQQFRIVFLTVITVACVQTANG